MGSAAVSFTETTMSIIITPELLRPLSHDEHFSRERSPVKGRLHQSQNDRGFRTNPTRDELLLRFLSCPQLIESSDGRDKWHINDPIVLLPLE